MMTHKNLKVLERMEILITSHKKVFLGNKYDSYIHTARNAKITSTRNVYEKTIMKRKMKSFSEAYLELNSYIYNEAFLRK